MDQRLLDALLLFNIIAYLVVTLAYLIDKFSVFDNIRYVSKYSRFYVLKSLRLVFTISTVICFLLLIQNFIKHYTIEVSFLAIMMISFSCFIFSDDLLTQFRKK